MRSLLLAAVLAGTASPVLAASCGGDFDTFIAAFSREAAAQRISQRTLASAFEERHPLDGQFRAEHER